jgi:transposase
MFHRRDLCGGEKGGSCVGKTKRGKGTKLMAVADSSGFPLAVHIASAAPHEVTLVRETLQRRFLQARPKRLIGDRAYDSDPLDRELQQDGIEVISPHKQNRVKPKTQDGRPLRRYVKRWRIERLFAWMHNFRRLVVRYEYHAENFLGFVHLACIMILLRKGF